MRSCVERIRRAVKVTPYSCAVAYAMKGKTESVMDVCRRADDAMYKEKHRMKAEAEKNGETLHLRVDRLNYFRQGE